VSARFYPQPARDGALRAVRFVRLLAKGIDHSLRRLSRIPSREAAVAPAWDLFRGSLNNYRPDPIMGAQKQHVGAAPREKTVGYHPGYLIERCFQLNGT
jgi:hypothetical protein